MAGLSKQAVVNLILQYIGGSPLDQIESTVVAGAPVAIQRGVASFGSLSSLSGIFDSLAAGDILGAFTALSENPLGDVLGGLESDILGMVSDNFGGLDTMLADIAGDPALADSFNALKEAIGGADGRSGAALIAAVAKEHTDRIAGTALSSEDEASNTFSQLVG